MRACLCFLVLSCCSGTISFAQQGNAELIEGNKFYREGQYEKAIGSYKKAAEKSPNDPRVIYNSANALQKKGDANAALEGYQQLIAANKDKSVTQQAWYNKGVVHQQNKQLEESIAAWKEALKLDPEDKEARENLQKALREKKEQEQKKQDQQQQQKEQKQQKQPEPPPSKLNQKQVEQLLKALEQKEKDVQKKMQQKNASPRQPEKDW
ncbi:tetratricopeptide repeat protein [Flavihumibacter rivuli]|uniref:tetratricopeptide repeat protein n=1 Tax=Flavihumibacter rivuli TaxID=2838156 RepID=UPI001BDE91ED|nr:tetratricopeptide repeat protein [Flavihumibacter rivuli]ULQ56193.1 tetratricopeptide repeat protein [Flavihumibacter rivuli]